MVSREELILLLIHTSPSRTGHLPAIFKATRLQKLIFLATRESEVLATLCSQPYSFVPYNYGPYSSRLERDVARMEELGLLHVQGASPHPQSVDQMSFRFLTDHLRRPCQEFIVVLTSHGTRVVNAVLKRLKEEGLDPDLVIREFEHLHGRFTGQNVEAMLRYVYSKYPDFAIKSRRQDLRPDGEEEDEEGDHES